MTPGVMKNITALVTGGATSIGRSICFALAEQGAHVLIADVDAKEGQKTCADILAEGHRAEFIPCDVTKREQVSQAIDRPNRLDCVVNNAGIAGPNCELTGVGEDEFDRVLAINVKAVFLVMQAAIRRMRAQGGGAIVNVASVGGVVGTAGTS